MSDVGDWFKSIPPITRTWFAASVAFPLIGVLGLIDFRNFILVPELVISRFHVSRLFTPMTFYCSNIAKKGLGRCIFSVLSHLAFG